jgi:hypothetical protein
MGHGAGVYRRDRALGERHAFFEDREARYGAPMASRARPLSSLALLAAVLAACADAAPRPGYVYRVVRVLDAANACDPSAGGARETLDPAYLAVRDDLVNYRVFACASLDDCALATGGVARDGGTAAWNVPVPSFVFTPREPSGVGACEGSAATWRSGPMGADTLRLDVLTRTLTGIPREANGVCSGEFAESRAASTPCDNATRYEAERVKIP